ncbi:hypothetical protein E2F50_03660 [Rhizobium deserti]|uniref:Uncharacterized protein n=1 Tax=Rhizobium deserti TaxID=2547961 RepID=A0A4R5UMZ7_9HYPH|nr:hypothetical protein [Rhizobium deserti]TDK39231.1 hypothetical protein E2F50_03660 [Rhizobium deserti]
MLTITVEYDGRLAEGAAPDLEQAADNALRHLSRSRGQGEFFVLARMNGFPAAWEQTVPMTYVSASGSGTLHARDLVEHYEGAIETVAAVAGLRYGFAGKTRTAIEEAATYAISSAKFLQRLGWRRVDVGADLRRALARTPWLREIDIDALLLKHSA